MGALISLVAESNCDEFFFSDSCMEFCVPLSHSYSNITLLFFFCVCGYEGGNSRLPETLIWHSGLSILQSLTVDDLMDPFRHLIMSSKNIAEILFTIILTIMIQTCNILAWFNHYSSCFNKIQIMDSKPVRETAPSPLQNKWCHFPACRSSQAQPITVNYHNQCAAR